MLLCYYIALSSFIFAHLYVYECKINDDMLIHSRRTESNKRNLWLIELQVWGIVVKFKEAPDSLEQYSRSFENKMENFFHCKEFCPSHY